MENGNLNPIDSEMIESEISDSTAAIELDKEENEDNVVKIPFKETTNDAPMTEISPSEPISFKLLSKSQAEFEKENFLKGCKWAPDGTCLLTCSNDTILRIYDLDEKMLNQNGQEINELVPSLKIQEPEIIYDYAWYPFMNSSSPDTACLFSTSKDNPIHLFDAFTGQIRCSYKGYNHVDELVNAYSIAFNQDASKIYGGYKKSVKIFDISLPGRNYQEVRLDADQYKITGIISCIAFSQQSSGVYAVGSYSKQIGIYVETTNKPVCLIESHSGGITHLKFSPDGSKLYSGSRKDSDIYCWDVRNPGKLLQVFKREVNTNQRIYFDLYSTTSNDNDCKYLASGNHNGYVSVWKATDFDISVESEPLLASFMAHDDCVNGVSFHPFQNLFATTSGQRRLFPKPRPKKVPETSDSDSSSENEEIENITYENSLKIWTHNLK